MKIATTTAKGAIFQKHLGALRPAEPAAEALLARISHDEMVRVEIKKPRNLAHHRKFWALMNLVAQNQDHYRDANEVCDAFKFAIGHYDEQRFVIAGETYVHKRPRSISFAKMDQIGFADFYDRAIQFLITEVIPGLNREDLERELLEFAA